MKSFLLLGILAIAVLKTSAQGNKTSNLPAGKYEIKFKASQGSWEAGDIFILNDNEYKTSMKSEPGEFKFSVTAQRIFFTSGPLKGIYAVTRLNENQPVIVFPVSENQSLNLTSEVWGYLKNSKY